MNSVNERNAHTLADAIKQDRANIDALRERVQHLEKQVAMNAEAINSLSQRLAMATSRRGHGPTSG